MKTVCQLEPGRDYPLNHARDGPTLKKMHKCEFQLCKGIPALPEAHCPLLVMLRMQCQWGSAARTWMERENEMGVFAHVHTSLPHRPPYCSHHNDRSLGDQLLKALAFLTNQSPS